LKNLLYRENVKLLHVSSAAPKKPEKTEAEEEEGAVSQNVNEHE